MSLETRTRPPRLREVKKTVFVQLEVAANRVLGSLALYQPAEELGLSNLSIRQHSIEITEIVLDVLNRLDSGVFIDLAPGDCGG
jgi:hypothetical protein